MVQGKRRKQQAIYRTLVKQVSKAWKQGRYSDPLGPSMVQAATNKARLARSQVANALRSPPPKYSSPYRGGRRVRGFGLGKGGAKSSHSSGFIRRGAARKTPEAHFAEKGVVFCKEFGGIRQAFVDPGNSKLSTQTVYIGHSTVAYEQLQRNMWRSFVKCILAKLNMHPASTQVDVGIQAGRNLVWTMTHKVSPASAIVTYSHVMIAANTIESFATQLRDYYQALNSPNLQLLQLVVYDGATVCRGSFNLSKLKVQVYCKSSLKIQNRTTAEDGDENGDDVDNVPLYGKSYEGKGNGALYLAEEVQGANDTFIANRLNGLIAPQEPYAIQTTSWATGTLLTVSSNGSSLQEPPPANMFQYVKKHGKIHLDPGQVKTSVLTFRKSFNFSYLLGQIIPSAAQADTNGLMRIGNFRFMAVEKMIQAVASTDLNSIKLAYEHDFKLGCICTVPLVRLTTFLVDLEPK